MLKRKTNRVEISLGALRDREMKGSKIINKMIELNVDGERIAKNRN